MNNNKKPTRRTVRVVGGTSEQLLKCPECGSREMRTYKLDSTLLFCPRCTYTTPARQVKRDIVVVPPPEQTNQTFIAQVPSHRKPHKEEKPMMERNLRAKGYDIQDYQEFATDEISP